MKGSTKTVVAHAVAALEAKIGARSYGKGSALARLTPISCGPCVSDPCSR